MVRGLSAIDHANTVHASSAVRILALTNHMAREDSAAHAFEVLHVCKRVLRPRRTARNGAGTAFTLGAAKMCAWA